MAQASAIPFPTRNRNVDTVLSGSLRRRMAASPPSDSSSALPPPNQPIALRGPNQAVPSRIHPFQGHDAEELASQRRNMLSDSEGPRLQSIRPVSPLLLSVAEDDTASHYSTTATAADSTSVSSSEDLQDRDWLAWPHGPRHTANFAQEPVLPDQEPRESGERSLAVESWSRAVQTMEASSDHISDGLGAVRRRLDHIRQLLEEVSNALSLSSEPAPS